MEDKAYFFDFADEVREKTTKAISHAHQIIRQQKPMTDYQVFDAGNKNPRIIKLRELYVLLEELEDVLRTEE